MSSTVYIVHCVDAEGPLYEDIYVPFSQIKKKFGIDIDPCKENLVRIQNGEIPLGEHRDAILNLIDPQKVSINGNWSDIEKSIYAVISDDCRNQLPDSNNNGWIYNWFCLDHVGFTGANPRRRDYGYHKVFDWYMKMASMQDKGDTIQFHHHPVSHSGNFHECGTATWGRSTLNDILCRRIIDRKWFPSVYRPGFHTERPDTNWFLEQWIPFDYANQSTKGVDTDQPDLTGGRFGDWRRAPKEWIPYHPDHDDYQKKGSCRRWITKCLNMYARLREIEQEDVDDAFEQARQYGSSILSFTDHDFKDMRFDINRVIDMIRNSTYKYTDVRFEYTDAVTAIKKCCGIKDSYPCLNCKIDAESKKMIVESEGEVFGPQPYLSIKTSSGKYIWDNFDFQSSNCWTYIFDDDSIRLDLIEKIGVAANSPSGNTEIQIYDNYINCWEKRLWNY